MIIEGCSGTSFRQGDGMLEDILRQAVVANRLDKQMMPHRRLVTQTLEKSSLISFG